MVKKRIIKIIAVILLGVLSIFYVKHKQKEGTRLRKESEERL
jgi:hypothetical protein